MVLFIGPTDDLSAEAWLVMATWDVQRQEDDTVVAVHPHRELWRRLRPDDYPTHRAALEMEMPAFKQAVTAAHQARVAEYGGRIGADPSLPMLVTNVDQLRQFFTALTPWHKTNCFKVYSYDIVITKRFYGFVDRADNKVSGYYHN